MENERKTAHEEDVFDEALNLLSVIHKQDFVDVALCVWEGLSMEAACDHHSHALYEYAIIIISINSDSFLDTWWLKDTRSWLKRKNTVSSGDTKEIRTYPSRDQLPRTALFYLDCIKPFWLSFALLPSAHHVLNDAHCLA